MAGHVVVDAGPLIHLTQAGALSLLDEFEALTAGALEGELRTLPRDSPTDHEGLPMQMVYRGNRALVRPVRHVNRLNRGLERPTEVLGLR